MLRLSTQCRSIVLRGSESILLSARISSAIHHSFVPFAQPARCPDFRFMHTSRHALSDDEKKKNKWYHITMSEEKKKEKEKKIEEMKKEEAPKTLFAKVKYYLKRYWYIAVPAHMVSCSAWFALFYLLVKSGVDVVALLETLHSPSWIVEKIKSTDQSAGVIVIALLLYKIALPIRYATTLALIQASFWTLRRLGKLKTAREVEYKVRTEYEKNKRLYGRRIYRYRHLGVRSVARKNSTHANSSSQLQRIQKDHETMKKN
ncbi:unnamed protein product [Caenorhabditis bovis]|uniref:DUF1279 domain-containing protein n=1 Tax=Caenorhabditis bovis TaxID=2654633 RepID=A0A8S1EIB1_9PELO|nr:unnamed protein product [Caenorhabditis bovis]